MTVARARDPVEDPDEDESVDLGFPLMVTLEQAARMCQVSVRTVREWSYQPGFPVMRSARQVRIHARLFDEWLAARAQEAKVDAA